MPRICKACFIFSLLVWHAIDQPNSLRKRGSIGASTCDGSTDTTPGAVAHFAPILLQMHWSLHPHSLALRRPETKARIENDNDLFWFDSCLRKMAPGQKQLCCVQVRSQKLSVGLGNAANAHQKGCPDFDQPTIRWHMFFCARK